MLAGRKDMEQFWVLFQKFIEFHREQIYPPQVRNLLEYDERTMQKQLEDLVKKAETDDSTFITFVWDDDKMVAFGIATITDYWAGGKLLDIDSVYVDDGYRGRGIGTRILQKMLEWGKEKGVRVASVHVALQNDRMLSILEKFGFVPFNIELRKQF